jgi:Rrf2 family protein
MRLELTRRGDYAVRAMLALADGGAREPVEPVSVREIAGAMAIPVTLLPRVMADLVRAGLVVSSIGRRGGYSLARPAEAISLLQVIEASEGDSRRQTCVLRAAPCGRDGHCPAHAAFFAAQEALLGSLAGVSLADIPRGAAARV